MAKASIKERLERDTGDIALTEMIKLSRPAEYKELVKRDKDIPTLLKMWEEQNPEHVARIKAVIAVNKKSKK